MKIIYNYITTNNINGKQYVGMHSTDNIDDGYLGSGLALIRAIKKYGKENFIREILWVCLDLREAFSNEAIYIKKYNTLQPNGYNISPTGGLRLRGCFSKETKRKIGEANKISLKGKKHSEDAKRKINEANKGEKNGNFGKVVSEETRKKMSEIKTGKKRKPFTKETKRKMSIAQQKRRSILCL